MPPGWMEVLDPGLKLSDAERAELVDPKLLAVPTDTDLSEQSGTVALDANSDPDGCQARREDHEPETHLIPLVLQAAMGRRAQVDVLGTDYATPDGTAVRDYIHVQDLAEAHEYTLEDFKKRTLWERFGEWFAIPFRSQF